MSALYIMRYQGQSATGMGAIYVGGGTIVGVDAANIRYHGSYIEENGKMKGEVMLSSPPGGAMLVTGDSLPADQTIEITIDWRLDFADGTALELSVIGRQVQVTFEKVGDIP